MLASSSKRARSSMMTVTSLSGLRRGHQRIDDRRVIAGPIERLLDREHARIGWRPGAAGP